MSNELTIGREPITIVEIDQDLCVHDYGVYPCQAALGVTGEHKCFRTRVTCQDEVAYERGDPLTLRFCESFENLPRDILLIPTIVSVEVTPTEINIGGSDKSSSPLGRRASIKIELRDHPHHDRGIDPYWDERSYKADILNRGTFWSRWLVRNPYYQGRALRVYDGYVGQSLGEMRVRHYIIEKIEGPTNDRISITAKDPIKLLEFARSQAPIPNDGVLSAVMDEIMYEAVLLPEGIGDEQYSESGIARIGSELVAFTRDGDNIILTERGLRKTDISEHKQGDTFQEVYVVDGRRVDEVLRELLIDYAGMNPDFIDAEAWALEAELWSASLVVSSWITEPTSISQLVGEILSQTLCYIWWDLLTQSIEFKVMRQRLVQIDDDSRPVNDDVHVVSGSVEISSSPEDRISQVWIYYDQIDPTGGLDAKNFARLRVKTDADAESADQYGQSRVEEIFARWLGNGADPVASALAIRKLQRNRDTPQKISFSVDAKDRSIKAADFLALTHHAIVDFVGAPSEVELQVTSVDETEPGHRHIIETVKVDGLQEGHGFVAEHSDPDYDATTEEQRFWGTWIAPDTEVFDDGSPAYRII